MLDDTLIIWGGEFGRTIYSQGGLSKRTTAATIILAASPCGWLAAAFKGGTIYGETDDFSYNIVRDPVHIRDFHATVLNQLGYDHERLNIQVSGTGSATNRGVAIEGDSEINYLILIAVFR